MYLHYIYIYTDIDICVRWTYIHSEPHLFENLQALSP